MNSTFTRILRTVLGLGLIFFGLIKLIKFDFMPTPTFSDDASLFMESLNNTGYFIRVIAFFEIIIGLLLLFNKWVPFALILLVPITVNVFLFHLFLDSPGLILAIVVVFLNAIMIYKHWKSFRPLFH